MNKQATKSDFQMAALELLAKGQWPLGQLAAAAATKVGLDYKPWRFFDLWMPQLKRLCNQGTEIEVVGWTRHPSTDLKPEMVAFITPCGREVLERYQPSCDCRSHGTMRSHARHH